MSKSNGYFFGFFRAGCFVATTVSLGAAVLLSGSAVAASCKFAGANAQQLFDAIKAGQLKPDAGNAEWTCLYKGGKATPIQQEASSKWDQYRRQPASPPPVQQPKPVVQAPPPPQPSKAVSNAPSGTSGTASAHAVAVATNCQCVVFVKNKIGYEGSLTGCPTCGAKDAGKSLLSAGYRWYGTPAKGDVVVFQPSFKSIDGKGVDQTSGHIAFIDNASFDNSRKEWTIIFLGANQNSMPGYYAGRSENKCDNVTLVKRVYKDFSDEKSRTLSFYRK